MSTPIHQFFYDSDEDRLSVHESPPDSEVDSELLNASDSGSDDDGYEYEGSVGYEHQLTAQNDANPHTKEVASRHAYTARQKLAVAEYALKNTQTAAGQKFGVNQCLVSKWIKAMEEYKDSVKRGEGKMMRCRPPGRYQALWDSAYRHFEELDSEGIVVTVGHMRRWMANEDAHFLLLKRKYQYRNIARWKKRHGLCQRRVTGLTQLLPDDFEQRIANFNAILTASFINKRPSFIVVLDEISVIHNAAPRTCLKKRGSQRVSIHINGNEKTASTALFWTYANVSYDEHGNAKITDAQHGEPLVIFKGTVSDDYEIQWRKNTVAAKLKGLPVNKKVHWAVTENGWMNAALFEAFVRKRLPTLPDKNGWIVMDLYPAHKEEEVMKTINTKGYTAHFVPAGCTSKVQYHDVYVNRIFKYHLEDEWVAALAVNKKFNPDRQYVRDTVGRIIGRLPTEKIAPALMTLIFNPMRDVLLKQSFPTRSTISHAVAKRNASKRAREKDKIEAEVAKKETERQKRTNRFLEREIARMKKEIEKLQKSKSK